MCLASNRLFNLNMNDNNKQLLLEILKMKLSVAAVEQIKLYTDTQKCEAVNRALSVSLPKNVNFSATMEGRASSAIHRINIREHLQLRNVKVRVLSCQHGRRELWDHLMLRQNIPEIMLRDQKLLKINSFNTVTTFKNIRNISV